MVSMTFVIANIMIMLVVLPVLADAYPGGSAQSRPTEETDTQAHKVNLMILHITTTYLVGHHIQS